MKKQLTDIAIRATKTALQSGLAVLIAAGAGYVDAGVWKAAAIAAGAGAISALQNGLNGLRTSDEA
jgi:hypothetical protein